ncbi:MAG: cyclic pyranopterin monophosphate synthase MoaC [Acidimicrobiales bacterium]
MSDAEHPDGLTHLDSSGRAHMVDVTPKAQTHRVATARATVQMLPETVSAITGGDIKKGDVLGVARIAGIQAAKKTSDLIPLCHPLMLSKVSIGFAVDVDSISVEATVEIVDRTGVEMEALTACSVAALTIYDMCKAIDKGIVVTDIALWHKTGGRSGDFHRAESVGSNTTPSFDE